MNRAAPSSLVWSSLLWSFPLLVALLATPLAGCYETPQPECAFYCGADNACPDGYRCAGDGWCKRMDVDEGFACGVVPSDAGTADAAPIDATTADAAVIDATPVDAAPVDGAPADAEPGDTDAQPADAAPADATPANAAQLGAVPPDPAPNAAINASFPGAAPDAKRATLR